MATWTTLTRDTTADGHTITLLVGTTGKGATCKHLFQICRNGTGVATATTPTDAHTAYTRVLTGA